MSLIAWLILRPDSATIDNKISRKIGEVRQSKHVRFSMSKVKITRKDKPFGSSG